MTERASPGPESDLVARTPAGEPNVEIQTLEPWKMVAIRVVRTYLQSLLGFLIAGGVGADQALGVDLSVFGGLFATSAGLAVAPAVVSLLQNAIEILSKLDITNPTWRA